MDKQRRQLMKQGLLLAGLGSFPHYLLGQRNAALNTLRVPALETGTADNGIRQFRLIAAQANSQFLSGMTTPTLGINGDYLGPTLLLRRDDDVTISVNNRLQAPTTLHWHGMHIPASADGGPHQVIDPGGSWTANFRVQQAPGTFWYHSHLLGSTAEQVYQGMAGMIIVTNESEQNSSLPSEYGVDDIPLIVQDRRFNSDGSFAYMTMPSDRMTGMFGNEVLVNGTYNPLFTPATTRVRFRLLNAANARTFVFAFDDERAFDVVSNSGGWLEEPVATNRIILAPAERADIVVDFSDGSPVNLISEPLPLDSPFATQGMMRNMHRINLDRLHILAIEPQSTLQVAAQLPQQLATIERIVETEAIRQRRFILSMSMGMMGGGGPGRGRGPGGMMGGMNGMFQINGATMDMSVINHRIPMGSTEIWEIVNDSPMMHPFHVHHGLFQLLDRNNDN